MIRREAGFTLVELLIAMTIFVLTIAAATAIFVPLLTQFKQQSRIAESNIEGMTGLDILRRDIEHAGFGIPWNIPTEMTYSEASSSPASDYNEPTTGGTTNSPRAIFTGNDAGNAADNIVPGSDYLVIKSNLVATNETASKWTEIKTLVDPATNTKFRMVRQWPTAAENLKTDDRVIVLIPSKGEYNQKILVTDAAKKFTVNFQESYFTDGAFPEDFSPSMPGDNFLIYGIAPPGDPLLMPFNRADYYVSLESVPARCAPTTGVLRKAVLNHSGTFAGGIHPLLDCVADLQVIYRLDTDGDGDAETDANDLTAMTTQEIRDQVKSVSVFILAHEGQRDVNFTFQPPILPSTINVGEPVSSGRPFDLSSIQNWQNYRWKVYRIVVKPKNLRS
jgi:prepilin-type N-terminal cleavage/methylation domain-containing protein